MCSRCPGWCRATLNAAYGGEFFMSELRLAAKVLFYGSLLCCNGASRAMNFEAPTAQAGVAIKASGATELAMPKALAPLGPSFDCKNANSPPERLLCRDEELMHLDALMGQLYRMVRKREGSGSSALLTAQRGCRPARSRPNRRNVPAASKIKFAETLHAADVGSTCSIAANKSPYFKVSDPDHGYGGSSWTNTRQNRRSPVARGSDELSRVGHR